VVNYNYEQARIVLRMESLSSAQLGQLVQQVDDEATRIAAGQFDVEITGSSYLFKVLTDLLVHGQIISLLVSLFGVALVVGLIFRSVRFGLLSMIPLGFTITLNFGIMGWLNIPLDTATTMLASIAIGIGVDYTVHFLAKYRRERRARSLSNDAVSETIRTTGRAIVYNVVAVAAGFAVLLFSSFGPIATLGALVALSMGISGLAALTLLPAALLVSERKEKEA
jgi:predicted RND superfamily exporter protein